ncbi:golvesin C-terminal-like domain-containing protein [Actinophytocola sediminis]
MRVRPFDRSQFTNGRPTDADAARIRSILANATRYAVTTWYHEVKNFDAQTGDHLDFGGIAEHSIRPAASEAYALAVALATGGYDAAVTGVDERTARALTVRLVGSLAFRHRVNTEGGWGYDWQTALWAALAGNAGWLLWADLPAADREYVRRMVEFEANRFIGWPVPYWRNRAGGFNGACGDTKAEENAWNSRLLFLAVVMMPRHSRRAGWAYKANELSIGAFARPADLAAKQRTRGRPLGDWLEGTNIDDDGGLVNHSIYHPDYVTTLSEMISGGLIYGLARRRIPGNALRGATVLYQSLVARRWWPAPAPPCPNSPGFRPPAAANPTGTMYVHGTDDVYYPQGNDWGTARRAHFAELDVMVGAFGLDTAVPGRAVTWERLHAQRVLDMQQRPLAGGVPSDGSTYRSAGEDTYAGREEWVAARAAESWLTKWLAHHDALRTTNAAEQIVVANSDRGVVVTGSWTVGGPAVNGPGVFGTAVRYKGPGTGEASLRFTPRLTRTRSYDVFAWWFSAPAQATNAPYTVTHARGSATVRVNQRAGGGVWHRLGTFPMGTGDHVLISDDADGYVVADAILLRPA